MKRLVAALLLLATLAGTAAAATAAPAPPAAEPRVAATAAPTGTTVTGASWVTVTAPNGPTYLAAVFRPTDGKPHPGVLVLHGTEGFMPHHVQLAKDLAAKGFVAMAACWFAGHWNASPTGGAGPASYAGQIECPKAQKLTATLPVPAPMLAGIQPLVTALRAQPGVNGKVALFGHSRGSIAAVQLAAAKTGDALVAAGGVWFGLAPIGQPTVTIVGSNDPFVPSLLLNLFKPTLKGPKLELAYPGAGHRIVFEEPLRTDALTKTAAFLHKYLG